MKFLVTSILGLSGLATLGSAIPIRIVTIDAVAPLSPSAIDVGYITHSPSSAAAAAAAVENGNENADRIGKSNNLAPGWLKEFMEKYAPTSTETDTYSHPHSHGYKWSTTAAHPHPHGGPNDHSLSAGTDVSRVTISEWMYAPPLSEVSPPPPSSEEDGPAGEMMLVTRPDGVVVYEFVPAVEAHGGGGCVFRSFKNMVSSLTTHQLVVFLVTTSLMLLVILRLAFLIALLIHRAHLWANECPGQAAARRRRHLAREAELVDDGTSKAENVEDVDPVPAYTVDEQEEGEKDVLLPAYVERA